ncbi:hypothetical protein [Massilia sp. BJB1822]|uniref:hypothetical protein n=1 Tax=Massilia sp. BJB1822 TaxID=2744470 RepID=UPI001593BA0B|nr:hypothetical protein [Massilia sp. BJB1822]NVD97765.1 hypothetical protein [Massilia sp. BJB1822]
MLTQLIYMLIDKRAILQGTEDQLGDFVIGFDSDGPQIESRRHFRAVRATGELHTHFAAIGLNNLVGPAANQSQCPRAIPGKRQLIRAIFLDNAAAAGYAIVEVELNHRV